MNDIVFALFGMVLSVVVVVECGWMLLSASLRRAARRDLPVLLVLATQCLGLGMTAARLAVGIAADPVAGLVLSAVCCGCMSVVLAIRLSERSAGQ